MTNPHTPTTSEFGLALIAAVQAAGGSVEFSLDAEEYRDGKNLVPIVESAGPGRARLSYVPLGDLPPEIVLEILAKVVDGRGSHHARDSYRHDYAHQLEYDREQQPEHFLMTSMEREKYREAQALGFPVDTSSYTRFRESINRFEYDRGRRPERDRPFILSPGEQAEQKHLRACGHKIDNSSRRAWEESMQLARYREQEVRRPARAFHLTDDQIQDVVEKRASSVRPAPEPWTPPSVQRGDVGPIEAPRELE